MRVSGQLVGLMADATAAGYYMYLCPARTDCGHDICRSDRVTISYPAPLDGDPIFGVLRAHRDDLVTLARAVDKGVCVDAKD